MKKRLLNFFSSVSLVVLLSSCASTTSETEKNQTYTPAEKILLQQIEDLFYEGDYQSVIDKVSASSEVAQGSVEFNADALKYKAFSECLSNQEHNCSNTFRHLLKVNPNFDLKVSEVNHPQWGKVFMVEKTRFDEVQIGSIVRSYDRAIQGGDDTFFDHFSVGSRDSAIQAK